MLRDILSTFPGLGTWPCDEINYIWRYGNVRYPSDEFTPVMAHIKTCRYIRTQFNKIADRYNLDTVVEKTCANSLRVDFVNRVLPEAQYIFIRRNGLDVVASAMQRWSAKFDWKYVLRKARYIPLSNIPYYACRQLGNRLYRIKTYEHRLAFWGPRLHDMDEILGKYSLEEVCALQWKRCVDAAAYSFSTMPKERWIDVGYENFVRSPKEELKRLLDFLGIDSTSDILRQAVSGVRTESIGKGLENLSKESEEKLKPLIYETLVRYGYT